MSTILIVDPDERTLTRISNALRSAGFSVLTATTGAEASLLLPQASLVITELQLSDGSGLDLFSSLPTIIISSDANEETLISSLNAGADDFVVKPFSVRELVYRVRAVLRSHKATPPQRFFKVGPLTVDIENYDVSLDDKKLSVTKKEYELLKTMAANPRMVYPRELLMSRVWKTDYTGDMRLIDTHMRRLSSKGVMIDTVYGVGYRLGAG